MSDTSKNNTEQKPQRLEAAFVGPIMAFGVTLVVAVWYIAHLAFAEIVGGVDTAFGGLSPTAVGLIASTTILAMVLAVTFSEVSSVD